MRKDKEYVFQLRKEGKSYREIQRLTSISRATLTAWFKQEPWSQHMTQTNTQRNLERSRLHVLLMSQARKAKLAEFYRQAEREAVQEYEIFKKEPLFWAGLMIYAGEGDKRTRHLVRVTNTEFHLHKIFNAFACTYLGVKKEDIKCGLLLYPYHNESLCREMWSNLLEIKRENFYKTQTLHGKEKAKRLQYGVGMSIISSTVIKRKLSKWLAIAQDERFNY